MEEDEKDKEKLKRSCCFDTDNERECTVLFIYNRSAIAVYSRNYYRKKKL